MNRKTSIQALIDRVARDFKSLQSKYEDSLSEKRVSEDLKIDIKNLFENLRSCLDYIAQDIFDATIGATSPGTLYFPIRHTRPEFDRAINKDFPGLNASLPKVHALIEAVQPYNRDWLGKFNQLNNRNKHQDLEEQTRTETKRVTVSRGSGSGSVSWGPGVRFGSGVTVMGVPIDPKTQLPRPNAEVTTEIVTWVSFRFKETGDSVLPFIQISIDEVKGLFESLSEEI